VPSRPSCSIYEPGNAPCLYELEQLASIDRMKSTYILVFTGTFVSTNLMIELGCVKDWSLDLSKFGQAWPEPAGLGSTQSHCG
jgi:hypothetical protein